MNFVYQMPSGAQYMAPSIQAQYYEPSVQFQVDAQASTTQPRKEEEAKLSTVSPRAPQQHKNLGAKVPLGEALLPILLAIILVVTAYLAYGVCSMIVSRNARTCIQEDPHLISIILP
jgi:hypothetical protein